MKNIEKIILMQNREHEFEHSAAQATLTIISAFWQYIFNKLTDQIWSECPFTDVGAWKNEILEVLFCDEDME